MSEESTRPRPGKLKRFLRFGLNLVLLTLLGGLILFAWAYWNFGRDLPDIAVLEDYRPAQTTRILASDGTLIATLYQENRVWAPLETMSPWVVPALLATEDSRYFEHFGVDPAGIARVLVNTARTGEVREGASTLTMQLARTLFPMPDDDWKRKIREIFLSLQLDHRYSKEKLLELYLNQIYFGGGAYGIHAASQVYFKKAPQDLTLAEASLIVGLIQSPTRFCPLEHPERAFHRHEEVLERMLRVGTIDAGQAEQAREERQKMKFAGGQSRALALDKFPYFTSYVVKQLSQRYTEDQLYRGGLTVITALDLEFQKAAEAAVREEVERRSADLRVDNGALVVIQNGTGLIKAMVGGRGWTAENQFNRAFQARRQPGSSFKPATYAWALEAGYTPESRVSDSPVTFSDGSRYGWSPKNSDGRYLGILSMRQALRGSRNVCAAKILDEVGVEKVAELGQRMGIGTPIRPRLSIALGAIDASPLEMATFYSVIANDGQKIEVSAIKQVKNADGEILEEHLQPSAQRILQSSTAIALTSMLEDVVNAGTGTGARVSGVPIAGKTGTTDSFRDAWFCGFSSLYTCAVWVGNDNNQPMVYSYGGDLPATIFRRVMGEIHQGRQVAGFTPYSASNNGPRDFLKAAEVPPPTPEVEPDPVPELVEFEVEPEYVPPQREYQPPPGRSYLLPNTLDPELPVPDSLGGGAPPTE